MTTELDTIRDQALMGKLRQLLQNPQIDNARRGPLRLSAGIQRLYSLQRVIHTLYVPAWNTTGTPGATVEYVTNDAVTKLLVVTDVNGSYPTVVQANDTTVGWTYISVATDEARQHRWASHWIPTTTANLPQFSALAMRDTPGGVNTYCHVGFADDFFTVADASLSDWIRFTAQDGNWFASCKTGGNTTTVDTGVAISTTSPQELFIDIVDSGTVAFYINNVQVAVITSDIPSDTTVMIPQLGVANHGNFLSVAAEFRFGTHVGYSYLSTKPVG